MPRHDKARSDIQVLRAFAVGIVVVFHLFSSRLTGGFVGVDVFFAISGFLITTHLIERRPSAPRDLLAFWGRRIRRLLPSALTVLAVTAVASYLWLSESQWSDAISQIKAAALYAVNWRLADQAVDYLHATDTATPVQHYWSLAVEEQFYLLWPILILALGLLAWRAKNKRWAYGIGMSAVVLASFAYSIHETRSNPAAAYFVTPTRIWELGLGGLLAVVYLTLERALDVWNGRLRTPLAYVGWLLMAAVAWRFDAQTSFPSWHAALPVVGAILVIAARADLRWYRLRPLQWLGDNSYAIYLWHWPLIVLEPLTHGDRTRGLLDDVVIVVASLVLAWATTQWIERPIRTRAFWQGLVPTYALGAGGMAVVLALTVGWNVDLQHRQQDAAQQMAAALAEPSPCLGAGYLTPSHHCTPADIPALTIPAPAQVGIQGNAAWTTRASDGVLCETTMPELTFEECDFGDLQSSTVITLIGNSHAAQWLPALQVIAKEKHYKIAAMVAGRCPGLIDGTPPTLDIRMPNCAAWTSHVQQRLRQLKPALSIVTLLSSPWHSARDYETAYRPFLTGITAASQNVLVLRDNAGQLHGASSKNIYGKTMAPLAQCETSVSDRPGACSATRASMTYHDPLYSVAKQLADPKITTADLNDHICGPTRCDSVVGGVVVRYDGSHLTAAYATTLAPYLGPVVEKAMR